MVNSSHEYSSTTGLAFFANSDSVRMSLLRAVVLLLILFEFIVLDRIVDI